VGERVPARVTVIGLGNVFRGDDAAGIEAARSVRRDCRTPGIVVHELEGEPTRLLGYWDGCEAAVIVDAMRSGAAPGTVRRLDATRTRLPGEIGGSASTHAVPLHEALELGRALGRLPARLIVYGIEGESFATGDGLSEPVRAGLAELVPRVVAEALSLRDAPNERPPRSRTTAFSRQPPAPRQGAQR
jgi:hydrogenase maturation protease